VTLHAITHVPPPALERGERSFVGRPPIDMRLAYRQHDSYCALLGLCGATVTTLDDNRDYADAVFVEDTAVVFDGVAVMASPGAVSRRGEVAAMERELSKYRKIERIALPATLDGGDVVVTEKTILVGASLRTNEAGARSMADLTARFGFRVTRVPLHDCLHLKSACCALPDGRLLVNPAWLDASPLANFELVPIPASEPFGADFAVAGDSVIVSETNPRTAELIHKLGFKVRETPLSEFEKAEGGVTCLSILFDAP
jgi:dimethylargininase